MSEHDSGAYILVVDDDAQMRTVMRTVLEGAGHIVAEAADGAEAIVAASDDPTPDLILLDILMPNRDGWECLNDLKSHTRLRQIPVVLVTARGDTEDQFRGMADGADGYIVKPVEPDDLMRTVRRTLRSSAHENPSG